MIRVSGWVVGLVIGCGGASPPPAQPPITTQPQQPGPEIESPGPLKAPPEDPPTSPRVGRPPSGSPIETDLEPPRDSDPAPRPRATGTQAEIAAKLNDDARVLAKAGRYAEASAKLRDAVARVPEPNYFLNLCVSLYWEGKFADAITACSAVEKNNPVPSVKVKADKMIAKIKEEAAKQGLVVE